ncbi:MAG TPA: hypothetical protein IAA54_09890 [Candidatus Gallacutalibacter pullicola]|uniref:Uncharacterized protein n=2 Tax=Eubacteriales TaxID=186802 RepID=A0A9D1J242_9FIRM|nr:hypothetical protein [Candidatus Gallacutalibacter pullicola]HIU30419.1 hypothetical protein [Candidatus Egerieisoma faecipullorum]
MKNMAAALFLFVLGMLLTMASMVLGPFGITQWSIAAAVTASVFALMGMYFAYQSWHER